MAGEDNAQRWYATGKRKTAVARVWLRAGTGTIAVNRRAFEAYFPRETSRLVVLQPFEVTEQMGHFDVFATLAGGGISAQAEALRHGISKALLEYNVGLRDRLKLLHFHMGSQISNVRDIAGGMREATRYVVELQRAGKAPMKVAEFLRGTPLTSGARFT